MNTINLLNMMPYKEYVVLKPIYVLTTISGIRCKPKYKTPLKNDLGNREYITTLIKVKNNYSLLKK